MSFILDALRKSEAARRRSEAPDLFAAMPQAPLPAQTRPAWPLWALGVGGGLALIAALWLVLGRDAANPVSTPTSSPADAGATPAPVASATPPPLTTTTPTVIPPPTAPTAPTPPPPLPQPSAAPSTPPSPTTMPTRAAPAPVMPAPAIPPPSHTAPAVVASPVPPPAPPAALPAGDRIATLAELDPQVRKQLPPLKISMHLWNETASQRFVILDGQRLKEGDVLGELVIERITRDGVVVAWRGGRLKLSR